MFLPRGLFRKDCLSRIDFVLLAFLLGGCTHLEFPGLTPSPTPVAYREAYAGPGGISSAYRLRADDVLVFRIASGGGSVPIRFVADENGEKWLQQPVSRFRVRVGELQGRSVTLSTDSGSIPLFSGEGMKSGGAALVDSEWGKVQAATNAVLAVELEPRLSPDLIAPGDVVELTRRYSITFAVMGDTAGGPREPFILQRTERLSLPVDQRGYIAFPALTIPSDIIDADATPDDSAGPTPGKVAEARALRARLATAGDVLRVADPALPIAAQTSLEELASCLSEGSLFRFPKTSAPVDDRNRRCWRAGVSPYFGPGSTQSASVSDLVYSLSLAPRAWVLVDEEGKRYEVAMRNGDTVPDTVLRERQRLTGRPVFGIFCRHVYLVVVPRATIASDAERPFYVRVDKGAPASAAYRIWPGDTVYVTRSLPEASRPGDSLP